MTVSVKLWVQSSYFAPSYSGILAFIYVSAILCKRGWIKMRELGYNTISIVIESWEKLRRLNNYEEKAGAILFQR